MAIALGTLLFSSGAAGAFSYTVTKGDSVISIANYYGVSVSSIVTANDLDDADYIYVGQTLEVPSGSSSSGSAGQYVVQPGDTLSGIAEYYGVGVSAIVAANGLWDADQIFAGDVLTIPAYSYTLVAPHSPEVEALLEHFALLEGIDPGLVKAIAYQESGWQQGVTSYTGAMGIMQLQPETAAWLQNEVFGHRLDVRYSMYDNIKAGVRYLSILLSLTGGNARQSIAAYYQGYGAVSRGIMYEDTLQYVASVLSLQHTFWQ
ncbi:MAG TPA: LysM peptidoglycan-binding domain-containing protein [Dehalococcoidia bacterium]|nr:LysM peptidoglycan-binding domain-containing protein [Dehalococcoidia bacterium]